MLAGVAHEVGLAIGDHYRNAKLQLTVLLADSEPVAGTGAAPVEVASDDKARQGPSPAVPIG